MSTDVRTPDSEYQGGQEGHEEPFYPHYKGFVFHSKKAQYKYLQSLWPHQQHKIIAYLRYKNVMGKDPFVTIDEVAEEINTHRARASATLQKMFRRGHLIKDKSIRPYRYYFSDQGLVYADYIWWNYQKYHLDLYRYFTDIFFHLSHNIYSLDGDEFEKMESKIDYYQRMVEIEFAEIGIFYYINNPQLNE